jgi:hypothetical protein
MDTIFKRPNIEDSLSSSSKRQKTVEPEQPLWKRNWGTLRGPNKYMREAASNGDLEAVKGWLAAGVKLESADDYSPQENVLSTAILNGRRDVVEFILKEKEFKNVGMTDIDDDDDDDTGKTINVFEKAIKKGVDIAIIELLLTTPELYYITSSGKRIYITDKDMILNHNIKKEAIIIATNQRSADIVKLLNVDFKERRYNKIKFKKFIENEGKDLPPEMQGEVASFLNLGLNLGGKRKSKKSKRKTRKSKRKSKKSKRKSNKR